MPSACYEELAYSSDQLLRIDFLVSAPFSWYVHYIILFHFMSLAWWFCGPYYYRFSGLHLFPRACFMQKLLKTVGQRTDECYKVRAQVFKSPYWPTDDMWALSQSLELMIVLDRCWMDKVVIRVVIHVWWKQCIYTVSQLVVLHPMDSTVSRSPGNHTQFMSDNTGKERKRFLTPKILSPGQPRTRLLQSELHAFRKSWCKLEALYREGLAMVQSSYR